MTPPSDLTALLSPRSVAIVGASEDSTRIGGRPIRYMKAAGYEGTIYPVNPNRETVQELPAFPSLDALPQEIDFAVIALPAPKVLETAQAAAAKGAKGCMVFSSGFAEFDEAGEAMQQDLSELAQSSGMRIVGPNCLGLFNAEAGFYPTFTSSLDKNLPAPGPLSIASQSGAFGSHLFYLANQRRIGLRSWITTGNECDLHVAECIGDEPAIGLHVYGANVLGGTERYMWDPQTLEREPLDWSRYEGLARKASAAASAP